MLLFCSREVPHLQTMLGNYEQLDSVAGFTALCVRTYLVYTLFVFLLDNNYLCSRQRASAGSSARGAGAGAGAENLLAQIISPICRLMATTLSYFLLCRRDVASCQVGNVAVNSRTLCKLARTSSE